MEFLFMFIGLGFFLYVIHIIERSDKETYYRKVNEAREFGYREHMFDPPSKKSRLRR